MVYDVIIIGGGPAGLTAAIYVRRANKTALVIEKETFGGQITFSPKVENIPGFCEVSGNEFAERLVEQAMEQGADVECAEVLQILDGEVKTVVTDGGRYSAKAVIVATGAKHRRLGLEREEEFVGEGISFCAVCDGAFYEGKTVAVIGGGNTALQEALMLSELAKKVYVIQNLDFMTGERKSVELLEAKPNVEIILGTVVEKLLGESTLTGIMTRDAAGNSATIELDGMFIAIGHVPQNEPFADVVALNDYGYAVAGEDCLTARAGIFVAGDCRIKRIRQVATAASDGAIAALAAVDYIG